jgi:hypothetical protein
MKKQAKTTRYPAFKKGLSSISSIPRLAAAINASMRFVDVCTSSSSTHSFSHHFMLYGNYVHSIFKVLYE